MKKIGTYTAMGQFTCGTTLVERLQLFDGKFDTGFRIRSFECELENRTSTSTFTVSAKLATEPGISLETWDWGDSREVAWVVTSADANSISTDNKEYIDEDNMIVEDLYLGGYCQGSGSAVVNYKIKLDKYDITDWEGALAMVRNRSQA